MREEWRSIDGGFVATAGPVSSGLISSSEGAPARIFGDSMFEMFVRLIMAWKHHGFISYCNAMFFEMQGHTCDKGSMA